MSLYRVDVPKTAGGGVPLTRPNLPQPSVGRAVHYTSYGTPNGEYKPECRAATITEVGGWRTMAGSDETDEWVDGDVRHRQLLQVWDPTLCMLKVENPTGTFNNQVPFDVPPTAEDGTTSNTPGTWHWPERVE